MVGMGGICTCELEEEDRPTSVMTLDTGICIVGRGGDCTCELEQEDKADVSDDT